LLKKQNLSDIESCAFKVTVLRCIFDDNSSIFQRLLHSVVCHFEL